MLDNVIKMRNFNKDIKIIGVADRIESFDINEVY